MRHGTARPQMAVEQTELPLDAWGETPRAQRCEEAEPTATEAERSGDGDLMSQVVERYIRALELSRQATPADVPPDQRSALENTK